MKYRFRILKEDMSNEYDSEGNQLTKEQAEFFKNSKIRDKQGRLLVCYHGTNASFDVFDKQKSGSNWGNNLGKGFYFTPHKKFASAYGKFVKPFYLNIVKPFDILNSQGVINIFIQNDINFDDKKVVEMFKKNMDPWFILQWCTDYSCKTNNIKDDFNGLLITSGYDGIVDGIIGFNENYVAFDPNQIKSITNKTPTNSNNINEEI